jgi:transaldolase
MNSKNLKIKIYSDGADVAGMVSAAEQGVVTGFTTNPTLMKKS